ncbi:MAG TPA: tetratricopeptide repeat protein [Syntrophales bacterium]|nr:tetratricopeptide repeat protein [Syntrophales bacterium]
MERSNTNPVPYGGFLKTAGPWICAAMLVLAASVAGMWTAEAASSSDRPYSIHISSFQEEINAIKHVRQLAAKGWPTYYRKVILPRKGTWWRVYVGPYTSEAETGRQASRLKAQGLTRYAAIERTGPAEANPAPPPPAAKTVRIPERTAPTPEPAAPSNGKIIFPEKTRMEPIEHSRTVESARKPAAAGPAAPPVTPAQAGTSPAEPCRDDSCRSKPVSRDLPRMTEPPANTSRTASTPAPARPAIVEAKPERMEPAGTGGITWGDMKEEPAAGENDPRQPAAPAPSAEPTRSDSGTAPVRTAEWQATPAIPGDRLEARKSFNKANEYVAKGMLEIAVANYSRAIELDPSFAEAYNGRGITYEAIQRADLAISDYDAAIRLKPDYSEAFYNRALACRKSGRFDQARHNLESACALQHRRACELLAEMKGTRK